MADIKNRPVLVTGATGKQGGSVINALLALPGHPFTILAVTRDASAPAARALAARSPTIKLVQGNLNNVPNLFEEARKVEPRPIFAVYSVQVSMGQGVTPIGEIDQGKSLIYESIRAGVQHFVYSSVERGGDEESWNCRTPIPHFQTKHAIEHYLLSVTAARRKAGDNDMGWTILRPVAFMDNLAPGFPTKMFLAAMKNWLGNKKPIQWVATKDIGVFVAKALTDPAAWNHKAVGIAGDELSLEQMSKAFEGAFGKPMPIAYSVFGSALTCLVSELRLMIGWFASDGYRADVDACRTEYPEMTSFATWLARDSPFRGTEMSS